MDHILRSKVNIDPFRHVIYRFLPVTFIGVETDINFKANIYQLLVRLKTKIDSKKRLILVGFELLFLEQLVKLQSYIEILIVVDETLSSETVERINYNIPYGVNAGIMQIPVLPGPLGPTESMMIAIGFDGGSNYALIPESTRSILNFYLPNYYFGEVILLDPADITCLDRPEKGWVTVNKSIMFTQHLKPMS